MSALVLAQSSGGSVIATALPGLVIGVLMIASMWKVFTKAGQPGWASIIPIYNVFILLKVVGRPAWWLLLFLIPFVNFVAIIIVALDLAKSFGKGTGFGVGLLLLGFIFYPILAFSDARYVGPGGGGYHPGQPAGGQPVPRPL